MAGYKSPASTWCFLRSSQKLRAVVKYRLEQLNKPQGEVAKAVGIPQYRISSYLNGMHKPMSQYQLLKLCKYLSIRVELNVSLEEGLYGEEVKEPDILSKSSPF